MLSEFFFIDVFPQLKHWLQDYMRCLFHIKTLNCHTKSKSAKTACRLLSENFRYEYVYRYTPTKHKTKFLKWN